jgi:hypothetical protein
VAYGARLESVLGVSPRGFESPILRSENFAHCSRTGTAEPNTRHLTLSAKGAEVFTLII